MSDEYLDALRALREAYASIEASVRTIEHRRFELLAMAPDKRPAIDAVTRPDLLWELHALLHMAEPLR